MTILTLSNGQSGDLGSSSVGSDKVSVAFQAAIYSYTIRTYAGADIVDLAHANKFNTQYVYTGAGNDIVHGVSTSYPNDNVVRGPQVAIYDGSGNDKYYMGSSNGDYFQAGEGNDLYDGGGGKHDQISFQYAPSDEFAQTVHVQALTIDLAKKTAQTLGIFGSDTLLNIEDVITGNGKDHVTGNAADNLLSAYFGDDYLRGRGGNDSLTGGDGKDVLIGDAGADYFWLAESFSFPKRDIVKFYKATDSGLTFFADDKISGFDKGGGATDDKIDISSVAHGGAAHFVFKGTGNFSTKADGEVRLHVDGNSTFVQVDTDSDTKPEFEIWVGFVTGLKAGDFIL